MLFINIPNNLSNFILMVIITHERRPCWVLMIFIMNQKICYEILDEEFDENHVNPIASRKKQAEITVTFILAKVFIKEVLQISCEIILPINYVSEMFSTCIFCA